MACIFEIKLGASDVIAFLALVVAVLSALFAYWSWHEARRANQISLLGHKKEIYEAFFKLKMHMIQKAQLAEPGEVCKFYHSSKNAQIYLPSDLAKNMEKYFDACLEIANIHEKYGGISKASSDECKQHIDAEKVLAPKIESEIIKLLQKAQA